MEKLNKWLRKLKFFFGNSIAYKNYSVRKFKSGVKVTNKTLKTSTYIEKSFHNDIFLVYPLDDKNNIGTCIGEIILDEFIQSMERAHNILIKEI